jgi:hypothetical protein
VTKITTHKENHQGFYKVTHRIPNVLVYNKIPVPDVAVVRAWVQCGKFEVINKAIMA